MNLSGGQKQRLSIARALLKKPRILILDDCTSALDAATEAKVLEGIHRESPGMTVLLVSQRISTVMKADHILCIHDHGYFLCDGPYESSAHGNRTFCGVFDLFADPGRDKTDKSVISAAAGYSGKIKRPGGGNFRDQCGQGFRSGAGDGCKIR